MCCVFDFDKSVMVDKVNWTSPPLITVNDLCDDSLRMQCRASHFFDGNQIKVGKLKFIQIGQLVSPMKSSADVQNSITRRWYTLLDVFFPLDFIQFFL